MGNCYAIDILTKHFQNIRLCPIPTYIGCVCSLTPFNCFSLLSLPRVRATETFVYLKLRKQTYTWGTR